MQKHFRAFGLTDGVRLFPLKLARVIAGGTVRRLEHPHLYEFDAVAPTVASTMDQLLADVTGATPEDVAKLRDEFVPLGATLAQRYAVRNLPYPVRYAVTDEASFLLYSLVRMTHPRSMMETGVANGHSTYYLLHALRANGSGRLCSVDIGSDVGVLLDPAEREGWSYRRLDVRRQRQDLVACLDELPELDLFLHDSDHMYRWQMLEYCAAWAKLAAGGLLLSDDVDHSFAFIDFCVEHRTRPTLLLHVDKVFGILKTPRATA